MKKAQNRENAKNPRKKRVEAQIRKNDKIKKDEEKFGITWIRPKVN